MGNRQSSPSSSSAKWPAPRPEWKPCPVKAARKRALTMQVEVETFENTTGLHGPLTTSPGGCGNSMSNTRSRRLQDPGLHGNGNGNRNENGHTLIRQPSGLSSTPSRNTDQNSCPRVYGLAPLHGSSSASGSIVSDSEEEDEEYDYGDVSGVTYSRAPKRSPEFGKPSPSPSSTKQTQSSILSLPRNYCTLLFRPPPKQKKQHDAPSSSTNTRGPPLESLDQVITPPPPAKIRRGGPRNWKRRIRHLEADATAMLATIGEIEGSIFRENLRILEEDVLEGPFDLATICCKTLRRLATIGTRKGEVKGRRLEK